jgi:hypothetical protein
MVQVFITAPTSRESAAEQPGDLRPVAMNGQAMSAPNNPEVNLLGMQFFCGLWERFTTQQARESHDPQTRYGFMDMRKDWSNLQAEVRQMWVDTAAEIIQKQKKGRL